MQTFEQFFEPLYIVQSSSIAVTPNNVPVLVLFSSSALHHLDLCRHISIDNWVYDCTSPHFVDYKVTWVSSLFKHCFTLLNMCFKFTFQALSDYGIYLLSLVPHSLWLTSIWPPAIFALDFYDLSPVFIYDGVFFLHLETHFYICRYVI